jgi:hypothetical protein
MLNSAINNFSWAGTVSTLFYYSLSFSTIVFFLQIDQSKIAHAFRPVYLFDDVVAVIIFSK